MYWMILGNKTEEQQAKQTKTDEQLDNQEHLVTIPLEISIS
jgi:hypothetical protein